MEVPIVRTIDFLGPYWGPLIYGNHRVLILVLGFEPELFGMSGNPTLNYHDYCCASS